ncbi:hypothetical protein [Salinarimonas ramus]|uniref:Uncharacterized protein n=1 Tax=Salinarimonas ramus TaxID=690164 RepID=A0A917QJE1_9HYPH|nr:hypothetical protein [Salinarimonas ramus]GGK51794.1 hypothetical protein GCM10011322_43540 [Salinarimonas ramus]
MSTLYLSSEKQGGGGGMGPLEDSVARIYIDPVRHPNGWPEAVGAELFEELREVPNLHIVSARLDQVEAMQDIGGSTAVENFKKLGFHIVFLTARPISEKRSRGRQRLQAIEAALYQALQRELYIRSAEVDWMLLNHPSNARPPYLSSVHCFSAKIRELEQLARLKLSNKEDEPLATEDEESSDDTALADLFIERQLERGRKIKYGILGEERLTGEALRARYVNALEHTYKTESADVFDQRIEGVCTLIRFIARGCLRATTVAAVNARTDRIERKYGDVLRALDAKGGGTHVMQDMSYEQILKRFGKKAATAATNVNSADLRVENPQNFGDDSLRLDDMIGLAIFANVDPFEICSDHLLYHKVIECARAFSSYLHDGVEMPEDHKRMYLKAFTSKGEALLEYTAAGTLARIVALHFQLNRRALPRRPDR